MEESVILHRLESRQLSQRIEAIDELTSILQNSPKVQFSNKLTFFSSFKRILQKDEIPTRIKCTKLLNEFVPKLGGELETCMSFVMPNILFNMGANNMVLKRESIRLIKEFAVRTPAKNQLVRSVIGRVSITKTLQLQRKLLLTYLKLYQIFYNLMTAMTL